jgi:uncharacterized membrane protein YtjA (UPF0391 family)
MTRRYQHFFSIPIEYRAARAGGMRVASINANKENAIMLRAAIIFFVVGLLAMFLGMNNIGGLSVELGKLLLFVFVGLAIVSFVVSMVTGRRSGPPV